MRARERDRDPCPDLCRRIVALSRAYHDLPDVTLAAYCEALGIEALAGKRLAQSATRLPSPSRG